MAIHHPLLYLGQCLPDVYPKRYKIGSSTNLAKRKKEFSINEPTFLPICYWNIPDAKKWEKAVHYKLRRFMVKKICAVKWSFGRSSDDSEVFDLNPDPQFVVDLVQECLRTSKTPIFGDWSSLEDIAEVESEMECLLDWS